MSFASSASSGEPERPVPSDSTPSGSGTTEVAEHELAVSPSPKSAAAANDRAHAREMFVQLATLDEDDPERRAIRDQLVEMHLPLVEYLARRFRNRGEPLDDLIQVATIGLIKSVDRFDLERGRRVLHVRNTRPSSARSSGTSATRVGRSGSLAGCRNSSSR